MLGPWQGGYEPSHCSVALARQIVRLLNSWFNSTLDSTPETSMCRHIMGNQDALILRQDLGHVAADCMICDRLIEIYHRGYGFALFSNPARCGHGSGQTWHHFAGLMNIIAASSRGLPGVLSRIHSSTSRGAQRTNPLQVLAAVLTSG